MGQRRDGAYFGWLDTIRCKQKLLDYKTHVHRNQNHVLHSAHNIKYEKLKEPERYGSSGDILDMALNDVTHAYALSMVTVTHEFDHLRLYFIEH